jgi:hypothetical protein
MAHEEHLKILKQGAEVWNRWRVKHVGVLPDLRGATLSGMNLTWANLSQVDFSEADLSEADLYGADLSEAFLIKADLSWANLSGVNFIEAYLVEAYLIEAYLIEANFRGANLSQTDLSKAKLGKTVFVDVDLSAAKGLDVVEHHGPSFIGLDTIYRSHGQIPEAFLRGAGVPDAFIAYMGSLTGKALEYYSCFISYSHKDEAFAQRLHADLQDKGVRCWFAPEDMKIGDKIRPRIDESIRIHDKLLLILSEHSVASEWVEHEVEHALDLERERKAPVLFPIRLDDAVMESKIGWAGNIRRSRHIGDFCQWKDRDSYQRAFDRLLRDLKAEEG